MPLVVLLREYIAAQGVLTRGSCLVAEFLSSLQGA